MDEKNDILSFFLQDKPAKILLETYKNERTYPADISKVLSATYSHIVRVIKKLEDYGLIQSERQGRTKFVTLTPLGKEVSEHISALNESLKKLDDRTNLKADAKQEKS